MAVWTLSGISAHPISGAAEMLHGSAVAAARRPELYADLGGPDTVEGRFELLTLHVILLIDRLKSDAGAGDAVRQALFDAYISHLDGAMREMGVGDLAMGKRMRKLGEAFYGRAASYAEAFAALPDRSLLTSILSRTVLAGRHVDPDPLGAYVAKARTMLAGKTLDDLLAGDVRWPSP